MEYLWFLLPLILIVLCDSTWAPFQSDQVKEIYSHMTVTERRRAIARGALHGLILGALLGGVGLLGMPIGKWIFDSFLTGVIIVQPLGMLVIGALFWKLKPLIDQSEKEFLASMQWSKENGITSDRIVLRSS